MLLARKTKQQRLQAATSTGADNCTDEVNGASKSVIKSEKVHSAPTAVEIGGIRVHFPFRPYNCQKTYMEKVVRALHQSENALLESPTGTGKTLCLLCSTLAWQQERAGQIHAGAAEETAAAAASTANGVEIKPPAASNSTGAAVTNKVPTIIYASRTHSQLKQVVNELKSTRYRPRHAVLGSREQMCVHPKINAAKGATAADINHGCSRINKDRKCRFRNNLDGFVTAHNGVGGGGEFGLQPVLDIEELVNMGKKRNVCPFYLTRGHITNAELIFVPYNYLFDKEARTLTLTDVVWQDAIVIFDEAHNLESFASDSASFDLSGVDIAGCIAEVSRAVGYLQTMPDMAQDSSVKAENLVRLKSIFLQLDHYIEHVLPSTGGSYTGEYIFEIFAKGANLTFRNHVIFLSFVKQVNDMIMEISGNGIDSGRASSNSTGTPKLDHFSACVKRIFGTTTEGQCLAKARSYRVHVSPKNNVRSSANMQNGDRGGFMGANNLSKSNGRILSYWCFAPSLAMNELASLQVRSIIVTSGTLSPLPSYSLELGLPFPHRLENSHIITKEQISVQVIGKGVSGKVLSSAYGRRDDMDYIMELGNTIISLLKVIPGGVLIFFPSYGVMEKCVEQWGGPMSSRNQFPKFGKKNFFEARQRRQKIPTRKAKYCFPYSPIYNGQGSSVTGSNSSPWARLLAVKAVVMEPKSTADLKDVVKEFEKALSLPKSSGCVMMGVCRGKFSEGIDFADDKCRAVIITGLPFAPYLDPKVKLKREYLDAIRVTMTIRPNEDGGFGARNANITSSVRCGQNLSEATSLSGAEWYAQQAHRAVNQAVGRVIRHKSDYGAVLLLDSRFSEQRNQVGLSKWLRPCIEQQNGAGTAIGAMVKFFRGAKVRRNAGVPNVKLRYENEYENSFVKEENCDHDAEENMTKIAFIKRSSAEGHTEKSLGLPKSRIYGEDVVNDGYVRPDRVIKRIELSKLSREMDNKRLFQISERKKSDTDYIGQDTRKHTTGDSSGLAALYSSNNSKSNDLVSCQDAIGGKLLSRRKLTSRVSQSSTTKISDIITSAWTGLDVNVNAAKASPLRKITSITNQHVSAVMKSKKEDDRLPRRGQSHQQAKRFFELAKQRLSCSHFDEIRKLLISMKSSGDKKDEVAYLKSARMLVDLLLRYDDCTIGASQHSTSDCNHGYILVESLYSLLPPCYRVKIEKLACQMRLDKSIFKQKCADILTTEELQLVCSTLPSLMFNRERYFTRDIPKADEKSKQKELYLSRIECILKIVKKGDHNHQTRTLSLLYPLIPSNQRNSVKAMVHEIYVEEGVKRAKEVGRKDEINDCLPKGTRSVVHMSSKESGKTLEEKAEVIYQATSQATKKKGIESQKLQLTLESSRKTFEKQPRTSTQIVAPATSCLSRKNHVCDNIIMNPRQLKKARKLSDKESIGNSMPFEVRRTQQNGKPLHKKTSDFDPLDSCLLKAKAEAYKKKTPQLVRINRRMESRLPEDMMCNICNTNAKTPCMANCGHVACIQCWAQWLSRSDTCPTCRMPTEMQSLTKIAYEDKSGVGIPTMTQICASDDEDELEIIDIKPRSF